VNCGSYFTERIVKSQETCLCRDRQEPRAKANIFDFEISFFFGSCVLVLAIYS
jgi:hypothetical protein